MNLPKHFTHPQIGQKLHEDNVKCLLFAELLKAGFEVVAEVKINLSRYDLVVYDGSEPVVGIEVKNRPACTPNKHGRQWRKYECNRLPVIYCMGLRLIEETLERVRAIFEER